MGAELVQIHIDGWQPLRWLSCGPEHCTGEREHLVGAFCVVFLSSANHYQVSKHLLTDSDNNSSYAVWSTLMTGNLEVRKHSRNTLPLYKEVKAKKHKTVRTSVQLELWCTVLS